MQVFRHALVQLLGNFGAALKIGGLVLLSQLAFVYYLTPPVFTNIMLNSRFAARWYGQNTWVIWALIPVLAYSMLTVILWHRYVLCNEPARPFSAKLFGRVFWGYLWGVVKLTLVLIIASILLGLLLSFPLAFAVRLVAGLHWAFGLLILLLFQACITWLALRLATFLPGLAMGVKSPMFDGFAFSKRLDVQIFVCALIMTALEIGLGLLDRLVILPNSVTFYAYFYMLHTWFIAMLSVSILTTTYGHAIEGRPLNPARAA